jgi:putative ABC transport system substrate-binding protein
MTLRIREGPIVGVAGIAMAAALAGCTAASADPGFTVGLVTNNANGLRNVDGFVEEMAALGYIEGEDVTYMYADEPVQGEDLEDELEDMVEADVDLIFTAGTPTGVAAHRITRDTDIPVVFGVIADPIHAGVMTDLTAPGGNMTGVKLGQDQSRRLELLIEIAGDVDRIFIPFNPEDAAASSAVEQAVRVAPELGVELILGEARTDAEVMDTFAHLPEDIDGIFLVPDSTVNSHLEHIVSIAETRQLATSGPSLAQVEGGALTAYGFVHHDAGAQAARIADRVLKGVDPGTLPVENTESYLAINLIAAGDIGLEVSSDLLRRADIILRANDG